ncbi:MAG: recombinase family protein [Acutalibacteraceae bacterium]
MSCRTILYGYQVEDGKTKIKTDEAEIVKEVFSLYISGKTLNAIASFLNSRNVAYFQDEVRWNKNIINRMIENKKYMGTDIYPTIISSTAFQQAEKVKSQKSCKQKKQSAEVELLRKICVCGECGNRFKRVNTWGTREKWLCSAGCSCITYIDDAYLINAVARIFNSAIENPDTLRASPTSYYKPKKEVLSQENELLRLYEQPNIDFSVATKSIFALASARFDCFHYDKGEVSDELIRNVSQLSTLKKIEEKAIKKYIKQVRICPDGKIAAVFINDAQITANPGVK